jgi:hypothetical protein
VVNVQVRHRYQIPGERYWWDRDHVGVSATLPTPIVTEAHGLDCTQWLAAWLGQKALGDVCDLCDVCDECDLWLVACATHVTGVTCTTCVTCVTWVGLCDLSIVNLSPA